MAISVNLSLNVSLGGFQIFTGTDSTHVLDKFILTQNMYFSVKIWITELYLKILSTFQKKHLQAQ